MGFTKTTFICYIYIYGETKNIYIYTYESKARGSPRKMRFLEVRVWEKKGRGREGRGGEGIKTMTPVFTKRAFLLGLFKQYLSLIKQYLGLIGLYKI